MPRAAASCPACPELVEGSKVLTAWAPRRGALDQVSSTRKKDPSFLGKPFFLLMAGLSLYVGHTCNLTNRLFWHRCGFAARHTAARLPIKLVYKEEYSSKQVATIRELQLKSWSRKKKVALINGDLNRLKILSESRD